MLQKAIFVLGASLLATVTMLTVHGPVSAAPTLQLPWPTQQQHRISGGNTYGCGTHNLLTASSGSAYNADYYAIDFQFAEDQQVSSVASGTAIYADDADDGYGNKVIVDHGGGFTSTYAHLNSFAVAQGATISQGQVVGGAGGTGGYPVHLHMHVMLNLEAFKPERMSGVPALGDPSFGAYGACTGVTSPYWTAASPTWHAWDYWGPAADQTPGSISYDDVRPDHTHMVRRSGSDIGWNDIGNPGVGLAGSVAVTNANAQIRVVSRSGTVLYLKWRG